MSVEDQVRKLRSDAYYAYLDDKNKRAKELNKKADELERKLRESN